MIKSLITDISNNKSAHINTDNNINGLVVDTRPLKTFDNTLQFFTNNTYGKNLAQDGSSVGTPEYIHNGGDSVLWTATTIVGNVTDFDFTSTDYAYEGTQSIDCSNAEGGDVFQLEKPTGTLSINDYTALTGWIYITGAWGLPDDGLSIILYNTNTGLQVSENSVDLDNFVDGNNTNVWQKFTIPVSNFGITSDFNALRCTMLQDGTPPNFYLDNIELESTEGEGPLIYTVNPPKQKWLYINSFTFTYVGEYTNTLSIPNIPYNGFFNVNSLDNGLIYQRIQNGEIVLTSSLKRHLDIMTFGKFNTVGYGYDGTYSWVSIEINTTEPIILKNENEDYMQFILSDDLSGLEEFQINISGKLETRGL